MSCRVGSAYVEHRVYEGIDVFEETLSAYAPADVPDRMLGYLAACLQQPGPSTTVVQDLLGRPAIMFAERAIENAVAFRN